MGQETARMTKLIVGNWKMNGRTEAAASLAHALVAGADGLEAKLVVCPPATQLAAVGAIVAGSPVGLGGQDCAAEAEGAHTGDIAAVMLTDLGASYVILGHSERRSDRGETDAIVHAKTDAAIAAGLIPIVCVGETLAEREANRDEEVIDAQLAASLPDGFAAAGGVIAYEPVWAIGTGKAATEQDVATIHAMIRRALVERYGDAGAKIAILYGGSVKAANAASLLAVAEVGGALVGGASLKAEEFLSIARAAR